MGKNLSIANKVNVFLQKKIMLYKDLVDCLEREKNCLSTNDINSLWKLSQEKQFLVSDIESIKHQILVVMTDEGVKHNMTGFSFSTSKIIPLIEWEDLSQVQNIVLTINSLKFEIQNRVKENKAFVEECSSVIEELISIITKANRGGVVYGNNFYPKENPNLNLVFHEEV
ncbi:MAG: flagellar export chaperone FlgN [Desulfobacterales bacterium]|nr:flagellar export chaperone FlgN [Desulfobacterales bacterium]